MNERDVQGEEWRSTGGKARDGWRNELTGNEAVPPSWHGGSDQWTPNLGQEHQLSWTQQNGEHLKMNWTQGVSDDHVDYWDQDQGNMTGRGKQGGTTKGWGDQMCWAVPEPLVDKKAKDHGGKRISPNQ